MANKVKIGEVVKLSQGFAVNSKSKHLMSDSGLPLLRITDLINGTESQYLTESTAPVKCIAKENEIIYTRTGQVGLVFRGRKGVVHNNCFKVIPDAKYLTNDFVYWFLKQPHIIKLANDIASGSVQKDLNHSAFKSIDIDLLPLNIQEVNTSILNSIEQRIALNQQTNQTLEHMAQALFKSWFVDFDPVVDKALAAGNSIPDELAFRVEVRKKAHAMSGFQPLPENIRNLFPSKFEHTGESTVGIGGWVPEGWSVKKLSDLLCVRYGKDHKKLDEGEYPVYGSGGLMRRVNKFLHEGESVLIPRKGTLSNIMYVNEAFWSVDTMFFTIPKMPNVAKFSFFFLKRLNFDSMNVGSAVPSMTTKVLNSLQIVYPTEFILAKFDEILGSYFSKERFNQDNTKQLERIRDTLLPKLISGAISINKEVE